MSENSNRPIYAECGCLIEDKYADVCVTCEKCEACCACLKYEEWECQECGSGEFKRMEYGSRTVVISFRGDGRGAYVDDDWWDIDEEDWICSECGINATAIILQYIRMYG